VYPASSRLEIGIQEFEISMSRFDFGDSANNRLPLWLWISQSATLNP